ncbi:MAG: right-handed parallel beta-helix repeat-containing protein [Armatimonadetes bacterium]|nr:right-handed parallel beta-helix repeat-containing protein [Armatimonadota bacterium]
MNHRPFLPLLLCAVAALLTGCAYATDLYVSPAGSDKNDGKSLKTAFATAQYAADKAEPGDTVFFAEGKHTAPVGKTLLTVTRSGVPGKPIVFKNAPGARPVLVNNGGWEAIKVSGASHLQFRGLSLRGIAPEITVAEAEREKNNLNNPRTSGNGLNITDNKTTKTFPSHITVQECDIRDFPGGGLSAIHADFITFENNTVARCGFYAPYACSGISIYQPIDQGTDPGYKIVIRGNVSFENYNHVPFFYSNTDPEKRKVTDGNGIILDDYSNKQDFGGGSGKPYTGRTLIANNVVFGNGGSGIHTFLTHNVDIVHNYAANNNRHPGLREGQIFANMSHDIRVLNNILIAPAGKPVNSDYNNENVTYDHNVYSTADGSAPVFARELADNVLAPAPLLLSGWEKGGRGYSLTSVETLRKVATVFEGIPTDFFGNKRVVGKPVAGPFGTARQAKK